MRNPFRKETLEDIEEDTRGYRAKAEANRRAIESDIRISREIGREVGPRRAGSYWGSAGGRMYPTGSYYPSTPGKVAWSGGRVRWEVFREKYLDSSREERELLREAYIKGMVSGGTYKRADAIRKVDEMIERIEREEIGGLF